jgi:hypothetical protein
LGREAGFQSRAIRIHPHAAHAIVLPDDTKGKGIKELKVNKG